MQYLSFDRMTLVEKFADDARSLVFYFSDGIRISGSVSAFDKDGWIRLWGSETVYNLAHVMRIEVVES